MLGGILAGLLLAGSHVTDKTAIVPTNIFYVYFSENEPLACALNLFVLAILVRFAQTGAWSHYQSWLPRLLHVRVWMVAFAAIVVTAAGTFLAHHNYPFSMDEFAAKFQAMVFARGELAAKLPENWMPIEPWLRPIFIKPGPGGDTWVSAYLPVHAAFLAGFELLRLPWLLNPLLTGLSVLMVAVVARKAWPNRKEEPWIAVAVLATSAQFLVTGMTGYAMQAHLALNLVWLALYARQDRLGLSLAPIVGMAAVGLHQPHAHLLFAFPFCVRLLRNRQFGWAAYYLSAYLVSLGLAYAWWKIMTPSVISVSSGMISLPQWKQAVNQPLSFILLFSWQSVIAGFLLVFAIRSWRELPPLVRDAGWSCVTTIGFYLFFNYTQGHGWGHRYFHPVLGCFVLFATGGWSRFASQLGRERAIKTTAAASAMAVLVFLPLRGFQVHQAILPFYRADAALDQFEEPMLLLKPYHSWYGQDLIRNNPLDQMGPLRCSVGNRATGSFPMDSVNMDEVRGVSPEYLTQFGLVKAGE